MIVRESVGAPSAVAREWTLFDIEARFTEAVSSVEVLAKVLNLDERSGRMCP